MAFDVSEFQERYKKRAEAVKSRGMPPIGGEERLAFIKQAEEDYNNQPEPDYDFYDYDDIEDNK